MSEIPTSKETSPAKLTAQEVGYCKPPKKSQWKKGHSGNPSGKKKGTKSFKKAFQAVASKTVTVVNTHGIKKKQTLAQTVIDKAVESGLAGNAQITAQLTSLMQKMFLTDSDYEPPKQSLVFKQEGKVYLKFWLSDESVAEINRLKREIPRLLKQDCQSEPEPT